MAVSYRRNRNYKNQSKWTYELNEDLYKCHLKAKSDPNIGYMNRMKNLWYEIHPELSFFSAKNLRDQASRVEKIKVVMETEYRIDKNHNNNNVVSNDSTVVNFNVISEHLTTNSDTETINVENLVPETITSINDAIKDIFIQNVTSRNSMNFNKGNYSTRINKTPSPEILKAIDEVALQYLLEVQAREQRPPSLIDLNNNIYSAAVSVNQYLGQLIEKKEGNTKKQPELPKWLTHLQESINRTRRDIGHIMTINECKINNQYTKK